MASLELKNVAKQYGDQQIINNLNLTIADTEFVVLVGPSGCGKSTVLRMIAGLEEINGGEILIDGQVVNELEPKNRNIAMVFQDYALYPHLTVQKNMSFGLENQKIAKAEVHSRVMNAAEILGLQELMDRKPRQLSGGQRQRVAMGRAMVRDPKIFLFDEPLSNLDAKLRGQMRTEIKKLHQRVRTTIIFVTHDQVEAMTLADRVVVMQSGDIEQIGTPDEVYCFPVSKFVASFIGSPPMNFIQVDVVDSGHSIELVQGIRLRVPVNRQSQLRGHNRVILGVRPEHFVVANAGSDDIFAVNIDVLEPLGSDTLLYFKLKDQELIARVAPRLGVAAGGKISLSVDMDLTHFFDIDSQRRLEGHDPA